MRKLLIVIAIIAAAACSPLVQTQTPSKRLDPTLVSEMERFIECPAEGHTRAGHTLAPKDVALNRLKNRYEEPLLIDKSITIRAFLAPGDDKSRWNAASNTGVQITGYVVGVLPNIFGEACNGYKTDDAHTDTHVDIVAELKDMSDLNKHIIVEITPRIKFLARKRGEDLSTTGLINRFLNKKVTAKGWLLFDAPHIDHSFNTHPNDPKKQNWRATAWEVHPATNIELVK